MKKIGFMFSLPVMLTIFSLSSCDMEQVVDVDITRLKTRLVVNAVLIPEEEMLASVTLSRHILDNDMYFVPVQDASVTISGSDGVSQTLIYNQDVRRFHAPNFIPQPGVTYIINVSAADYTPVNATTYLDQSVPIDKIEKRGRAFIDEFTSGDVYYVQFIDNGQRDNYYRIKVEGVHSIYSTDPTISSDYRNYDELFFKDVLFSGKEASIPVIIPDHVSNGEPFVFRLENLSEGFYRYVETSALQQDVGGDPFAQPVTVFTNIENGFGIFGAYSISRKEFNP